MSDPIEDLEIEIESFDEEEESSHTKTEDLHLYFKQRWIDKVGPFGIFLILTFFCSCTLSMGILILSYTQEGRSFLQGLKILLF